MHTWLKGSGEIEEVKVPLGKPLHRKQLPCKRPRKRSAMVQGFGYVQNTWLILRMRYEQWSQSLPLKERLRALLAADSFLQRVLPEQPMWSHGPVLSTEICTRTQRNRIFKKRIGCKKSMVSHLMSPNDCQKRRAK